MVEASGSTREPGNASSVSAASNPAQPTQEKTLGLRLPSVNNSDQPVVVNTSSIHHAPGMAYFDFGFFEPGVLTALPHRVQQGSELPDEISSKLSVRVVMGFDGLGNLSQQLTLVMGEFAKSEKRMREGK